MTTNNDSRLLVQCSLIKLRLLLCCAAALWLTEAAQATVD